MKYRKIMSWDIKHQQQFSQGNSATSWKGVLGDSNNPS